VSYLSTDGGGNFFSFGLSPISLLFRICSCYISSILISYHEEDCSRLLLYLTYCETTDWSLFYSSKKGECLFWVKIIVRENVSLCYNATIVLLNQIKGVFRWTNLFHYWLYNRWRLHTPVSHSWKLQDYGVLSFQKRNSKMTRCNNARPKDKERKPKLSRDCVCCVYTCQSLTARMCKIKKAYGA